MTDPIPRLDHGVIGNGRVLALVAPTTHIDWLCLPRFDSASIFARLLDADQGGTFALQPTCGASDTRMAYVINTNVLRTEVRCPDGRFDVFDYAPRIPTGLGVEAPLEIHRLIVPREGAPRVRVLFDPRPDYGRVQPHLMPVAGGLDIGNGEHGLHLRTNVPAAYIENGQAVRIDGPKYFVLSIGRPPQIDSVASVQRSLDLTVAGWRAWAKTCALSSFADTHVLRSALSLKLHVFTETGGNHRLDHDEHPRSSGHGTYVGLPLLLAPGCRIRRRGASPSQSSGRRRGLRVLPSRCGGGGAASARLWHRRRARAA